MDIKYTPVTLPSSALLYGRHGQVRTILTDTIRFVFGCDLPLVSFGYENVCAHLQHKTNIPKYPISC